MKKSVAALVVLVALALVPAGMAVAAQSSKAAAVKAVKEEIGNEWEVLRTIPRKAHGVASAQAAVSCKGLSATRFRCSFTASSRVKKGGPLKPGFTAYASGQARVTVFPHGAEAEIVRGECHLESSGEIFTDAGCH